MFSRLETSGALRWTAIALLAIIGLIHLVEAPDQFSDATYKGLLFLANAGGCVVASAGVWHSERWGWALGALVAATTAIGYVLSRTLGLPGLPVDPDLFESAGVVSVIAELAFLGLTVAAFRQGSAAEETRPGRPVSPEEAA